VLSVLEIRRRRRRERIEGLRTLIGTPARTWTCDHGSQAAEKALKAVLLALDQEPPRTHAIERLLLQVEELAIDTTPLRQPPLKSLQQITTASRYPSGD
jgi:HEPN domain-containing protein